MGTDIHVFMEINTTPKEPILGNSNVILKDYYIPLNKFKYAIRFFKSDKSFNIEEDIYEDRNYLLFGYLSGVRTYGKQIELVHDGLPDNISEQLKKYITLNCAGYHSPGYFSLSELMSAINDMGNWMYYTLNDDIDKEIYGKMDDNILIYKFDNIISVDDFNQLPDYDNVKFGGSEYSNPEDIPSDSKVVFCRSYTLISFFERILEWLKINEYWGHKDLERTIPSDGSPLIKKILANPDLYSEVLNKYRMIILYDS